MNEAQIIVSQSCSPASLPRIAEDLDLGPIRPKKRVVVDDDDDE
jgi:hypothetical protein